MMTRPMTITPNCPARNPPGAPGCPNDLVSREVAQGPALWTRTAAAVVSM
jgi:hypothetical protein